MDFEITNSGWRRTVPLQVKPRPLRHRSGDIWVSRQTARRRQAVPGLEPSKAQDRRETQDDRYRRQHKAHDQLPPIIQPASHAVHAHEPGQQCW